MARGLCIGVDVGGTRLRVIAEDGAGVRSQIAEVPVPRAIEDVVTAVATLAHETAEGRPIRSIAIGLPGQTTSTIPIWIPNLRFLDSLPLAALVTARTGAPCTLVNDAHATLLAESHEGAAIGRRNVVLVAFGTGIGGAIQVNDEIVTGSNGCAGSFGWLPMDSSLPQPDHGQWEQVASGAALELLAQPWGSVAGILDAARAGQADAQIIIEEFGALIGRGLAGIASILDPDLIVFAGGLSKALDLLDGPIAAARATYSSPAARNVPLVAATLGPDAGVVGALAAARRAEHRSVRGRKEFNR